MVEKVAVDLENDYLAILPNGFVFMYQEDAYITDTVVSLVKLERAISWKHARNIRAIMFMALRPEDGRSLDGSIIWHLNWQEIYNYWIR